MAKGGIWCPGTWVYDETVPRPYYDPDLARAYLELGGYPEGFEVDAITFTDPTIMQQAEMYQAQLAEVGIIMNFDVFDTSTTASKFYVTQEYPMLLHRFSRYPEPDWKASLLFKSTGYYNPAKLPNPVMDNLIERGAATYDIAERKSIYRQVMEIVLGECWSVPYLYNTYYYGYWQDKVGGIDTLFGWDAKQQFRQIWLKP